MCGIAGYVDFETGAPRADILAAMVRCLGRRGPDAHGTLVEGPCGLAHTRLSILDIAGSPQPMVVPGADIALVYNGELYNYVERRGELQAAGETFVTSGDTEVVLRSVSREGRKSLPKLDGMFAFAAWDRRRQTLLLARDALGEKPLFYAAPTPGVLVFGSEVKAVLEHPAVDRALDFDALRQALRFRAVYGEGSLHLGVSQLAPGCFLEFSRTGARTGRFFDLVEAASRARDQFARTSDEHLIVQGEALFMQSVRERLIADVPVGAFLSGGLDSSMIVAAMRKVRAPGEEIETFSVGFTGDPHSELTYAAMVAERIGSRHRSVSVGPDSFQRRLAELSACRDAPMSEPADVAVAEMSRLARETVKVVLSGEGADEVFAGYPKYALANAPRVLGVALRWFGPANAARLAAMVGMDGARAITAFRSLSRPREVDRIVQWFSQTDRADLERLLPGLGWTNDAWSATMATQAEALSRISETSSLYRMQLVDCLSWLPGNMLERGDRMTMAEGVEMRPPFLDKELAAFALALPDRLKMHGRLGKWIVRQWGVDLLPEEILRRRKWGFRVPLTDWFRGPLRPMLADYLLSGRGLCGIYGNRAAVERLLHAHLSGQMDAAGPLWTLLSAEVWYQDVYLARLADLPKAAA